MATSAGLGCDPGQILHRIHDAVGVGERRGHDHSRPIAHRIPHSGRIGAPVTVQRDLHQIKAEVVRRFGIGRVGRPGRHDLRPVDAPCTGPLAVGEHRHENGLGASGRHGARRSGMLSRPLQQRCQCLHDLRLECGELRKPERVQGVAEQIAGVHLDDQLLDVRSTGWVGETEQPRGAHVRLGCLSITELLQYRSGRQPLFAHGLTVPVAGGRSRS
jgi:hypothetical protein